MSNSELDQLSPDELVSGFTKTGLLKFIVIAIALHLVIISVFSTGFIYEEMYLKNFDTPRYEELMAEREAAAKAKQQEEMVKRADARIPTAPAEDTTPDDNAATNGEGATAGADNPNMEGIPEDKRDNPVVKSITEAADPEDIPKGPSADDLGISIDDTNPN